jgi:hypothetical protein
MTQHTVISIPVCNPRHDTTCALRPNGQPCLTPAGHLTLTLCKATSRKTRLAACGQCLLAMLAAKISACGWCRQ